MFGIYSRSTGRRATVASFFQADRAERQIAQWRERQVKGGRPDISLQYLDDLEVRDDN